MNDIQLNMINDFQCPGCISGSSTECGSFKMKEEHGFFGCKAHIAGTMISGIGSINLGLPKGFNRVGCTFPHGMPKEMRTDNIRLYAEMPKNRWDKFNIPAWAREHEGFLYVRTYLPRTNRTFVDVIHNGKIADIPDITVPINVSEFVDDID